MLRCFCSFCCCSFFCLQKEKLKPDGDAADAIGTGELNVDETSVVVKAEEAITKEVAVAPEEEAANGGAHKQENSTMAQDDGSPL